VESIGGRQQFANWDRLEGAGIMNKAGDYEQGNG
jgi:hypothetical protein